MVHKQPCSPRSCRTNGNARPPGSFGSGCDEVEQALLGFVLSGADAVEQLAAKIDASLLFGPTNKIIFDAILTLHNEQRPIELLSLADRLRRENNLETVGGPAAVTQLGGKCSCRGVASARYYLELLRDPAVRRQLAAACQDILEQCHEENLDVCETLSQFEEKIGRLRLLGAAVKPLIEFMTPLEIQESSEIAILSAGRFS
jgi:replicative DNA helicase